MINQRNAKTLEALWRHRNGSVLQVMQGLEAYSAALKRDRESTASSTPPPIRSLPLCHRVASLKPSSSRIGSQHRVEYVDEESLDSLPRLSGNVDIDSHKCSDDGSFASAITSEPSSSSMTSIASTCSSEADVFLAKNQAYETVSVAPKQSNPTGGRRVRETAVSTHEVLSPRTLGRDITNPDFNCYNAYDEDLARQIEAMATEAEAVFVNRHSKKKSTSSHLGGDDVSYLTFSGQKSFRGTTTNLTEAIKPASDDMPRVEIASDASFGSLVSLSTDCTESTTFVSQS